MTLVIFQYPALMALFLLCMALTVLSLRKKNGKGILPVLTGLSGVALVILSLALAIPMAELLMMLSSLVLAACLLPSKEEWK